MPDQTRGGLVEIKVELAFEAAESVSDLLSEREEDRWSVVEDVILTRAWLVGIFETVQQANRSWSDLMAAGGLAVPETGPQIRVLPESEWRDSYKAHFRAWKFGRLHWVPVWEKETFQLPPGDAVLWLDPGLAFGTGNHETTRLCVERMVEYALRDVKGRSLIDAGCGSGILALSAAKLGFSEVEGFDNDVEAVRVSRENAMANGLETNVQFHVADLNRGLAGKRADVVVANILANILTHHANVLLNAVRPGGTLVLSGILAHESEAVANCFASLAPTWTCQSRRLGEWSDVVLLRP
jgi:ribosomal protein L11 methyltransferase